MSHVKDVYYFSHDSNARTDPKTAALINDFGMEGYGVYWAMIEILSEQDGYMLKKFNKLFAGLSRQLMIDESKLQNIVEAMIYDYELLVEDEDYIWSESLIRRMEIREIKRKARVEAGRLGGLKSGEARAKRTRNEAMLEANEALLQANEPTLEANEPMLQESNQRKGKNSKGKEKKINIYTQDEQEILDLWNSRGIVNHEPTNAMQKEISKALNKFGKENVIVAINNYAKLYKDSNFYYSHRWRLDKFLSQKNGLPDFLEDGQRWIDYQDKGNGNSSSATCESSWERYDRSNHSDTLVDKLCDVMEDV